MEKPEAKPKSTPEASALPEANALLKVPGVEKVLDLPVIKFGETLIQEHGVVVALERIGESQSGASLIAYEVILILVLWMARAWRLSKVNTLLTQFWTQAWIAGVYWILALAIVPSLVWGESYRTLLSHLVRAVLRRVLD
jgi:hypothetical protein